MNKLLRVLIIEDMPDDADLLLFELRRNGYEVRYERVDTASNLITALTTSEWDVILSDYSMPSFSAPAALKIIQGHQLDLPFIIISGTVGEDTAVTAMKAGAHDFFAKGKLLRLVPAIERELREVQERKQRRTAEIQLYEAMNQYAAELERRVDRRTSELQRTKEQVEAILNHSSEAIIMASADCLIQQINPSFIELFGIHREELQDYTLAMLFVTQQSAMLYETLWSAVDTRRVERIDLTACRKDGTLFDAEFAVVPIMEDADLPISLICSIRDITQRKLAEQELRLALEKEKELNELKSRFVSMVSHEFRTPMASILSSSDMLKLYGDRMNDDKKLQHLNRIDDQIKRMINLVNDVLTLSKADAVGIILNPTATDIKLFCRDIVEDLRLITPNNPINFICVGNTQSVPVDQELLRQALTNLLSNAIKYSSPGNAVEFEVRSTVDYIKFIIQDHGIGIPQEDQVHLFEAFHRAGNVQTIQGTGLGLVITKRAIEAHMGTIHFESEVGKGTTFTIHIPLQQNTTAGEPLKIIT